MLHKRKKKLSKPYARRIANAMKKGKTRQEARGHGRPPKTQVGAVDPQGRYERALRRMKQGLPLKKAAAEEHLSSEGLKAYVASQTTVTRERGRLRILDERPRQFPVYSDGQLKAPVLSNTEASRASTYMHSIDRLLNYGEVQRVEVFRGQGVTDVNDVFFPFETDANLLFRLDAAGELYFPEFYKITGREN